MSTKYYAMALPNPVSDPTKYKYDYISHSLLQIEYMIFP